MKFLKNTKLKIALLLLNHASESEKREILAESVKHLFNAVSVDDILKENPDGTIRFEDKVLTPSYRIDLKKQAILLNELLLWRVLKKDVQYQINKKIFIESKCDLDIVWGQLLIFLWDIINTRISKLK